MEDQSVRAYPVGDEAVRESPRWVEESINRLLKAIEDVDTCHDRLVARLSAVLTPDEPHLLSEDVAKDGRSMSDLARRLEVAAERLEGLARRQVALVGRIEV